MMREYFSLYKMIGKYKQEQILIALLCLFSMFLGILFPYFLAQFINKIQIGTEVNELLLYGLGLGILTVVSALMNGIQNYIWHKFRIKYINHVRVEMVNAVLSKDLNYFKENRIGEIQSKVLQDVVPIAEHIAIGLPVLVINIMRLIGVFIFMGILNLRLTGVVAVIAPIYFILFKSIHRQVRENSKKSSEAFANVTASLNEQINGISTIKIFKKEQFFYEKFKSNIARFESISFKNLKYNGISYGVTTLITGLLPVLILTYGSVLVSQGALAIGSLMGFYAYLNFLYEPMHNLVSWFLEAQVSLGMKHRITDFINGEAATIQEIMPEEKAMNKIRKIEFKEVSFAYPKGKQVFENLSFVISEGDKVAIKGKSGIGKSSIIQLLLKVYTEYTGEILINDVSLRKIETSKIFESISYVEQNSFVFSGSLAENIIFDKKHLEIKQFLDKAAVSDFADNMEFMVSENGKNLSGGQKQRISICRALMKNFDVLILDEATASLDRQVADRIIENVNDLVEENNKILITISHKPKDLQLCNKIIELKECL